MAYRTVHALALATLTSTLAAVTLAQKSGPRSLLGFESIQLATAPTSGASEIDFVKNSLSPLAYPIPGENSPLNFTLLISNTTDTSQTPEEPAHCTYCLLTSSGCSINGRGPVIISAPLSSAVEVNFRVPAAANPSTINLLRPENGTIIAYQPSPGGEPGAIIDQINYDAGNGTAIAGLFKSYPIPGSIGGMEALTGVTFRALANATDGYTIPLVAGLATNATEFGFINPSCYINVDFVVKKGPATLAPAAQPYLG